METFAQWIINEMPISKFELVGDWSPKAPKRGWDAPSIGILTNDKGVQKIKNKWANTEVDFDMYFVRQPGAMQHLEIGEVHPEYLQSELGLDIQPNPDAVTILFTQNRADGRIPMTAWTIGHRVGHAMARGRTKGYTAKFFQNARQFAEKEIREIWSMVYGSIGASNNYTNDFQFRQTSNDNQKLRYISQALGTMKSARNGVIRNFNEFVFELFGQYLLEGHIRFRKLPKTLGKRSAWGNDYHLYYKKSMHDFEEKEINYKLQFIAETLEYKFSEILHSATGKVFVM